jgi:membrane protein implicated in regulation of membrane protease activity
MRTFSLLFAFIALVVLAIFLIYLFRGPVDLLVAAGLFVSFLACLLPALFLLRPFEPPEELKRRREERKRRRGSSGETRDPGP